MADIVNDNVTETSGGDAAEEVTGGNPAPGESPEAPGRFAATDAIYWAAGILICAAAASWLRLEYPAANGGGYFIIVCLYALVGCAAVSDAALRRIPNRFNYPAMLLSAALTLVIAPVCEYLDAKEAVSWIGANSGDWGIAWESLKGFGLCAVVGLISFAARGLGGGDVKLLASVGLLTGWSLCVQILLNTLAVSLAIGIVNLLLRGMLVQTVQEVLVRCYTLVHNRNFKAPITFKRNESPFCVSLLLGMVLLRWVSAQELIMDILK